MTDGKDRCPKYFVGICALTCMTRNAKLLGKQYMDFSIGVSMDISMGISMSAHTFISDDDKLSFFGSFFSRSSYTFSMRVYEIIVC